jgi:hypothetical protein
MPSEPLPLTPLAPIVPGRVFAAPPEPEAVDPRAAPITLHAWMHMSNRAQNFSAPQKLNRFSQENEIDLLLSAPVFSVISLTADLAGTYGPTSATDGSLAGDFAVLDLIAKFDFDPLFHVWAGRMLVPSDRSNFSGFWFAAPFYYPGRFNLFATPVGPRTGPFGRNDGVTVWGELGGGLLKYYGGVYDLFTNNNPLLSGRVNLALLNPEPGYYHSSTYYGGKDIVALALGAQYQRGKGAEPNYGEFNADLLFEKNFFAAGVVDLEGAVYKYDGSDTDYSYFVLASYMLPGKQGPGTFQPLIRLQQAKRVTGGDAWTMVDLQIAYVLDNYFARLALGYQYTQIDDMRGNALFLGIQLQK